MRPSQSTAYSQLSGAARLVLNAPTGWGKTTVLAALAGRDLADPGRKVLIAVPQRVIARGFLKPLLIETPEGPVEWSVGNDLCGTATDKVRSLVDFLRSRPTSGTAPRVAVASHAGLCRAFSLLEEEGRLAEAISRTTFVIDECHHVRAGEDDANRLGHAVTAMLGVPSAKVWLATAFFFRGDRLPILEEGRLDDFVRFHLPFDEYLKELRHLRGYEYDFVAYKGTVFPEVGQVLARGPEPTLIFCPPAGSPVLGGLRKEAFVGRLIELVLEHDPGSRPWVPGIAGDRLVLDLTDEADRDAKVGLIMNEGHRIATILTVGMMKEGADWVQASRCLDLSPSVSDQDRNQKFGRLVRDHPGKRRVRYLSFLPTLPGIGDRSQREACSRLFAHFHQSLILHNALDPILVAPGGRIDGGAGDGRHRERPVDLLGRLDAQAASGLLREATEGVLRLIAEGQGTDWRTVRGVLLEVLAGQGAGDVVGRANLPALARQIVLIWKRSRNPGLDLDSAVVEGFDKVWAADGLESFRLFTAGVCGLGTFAELRDVIGRAGREDAEGWARDCAARYRPGDLPSTYAQDPSIRRDAIRIFNLRRAKRGDGGCTFYPTVEAIFEAAGHRGVFDPADRRAEAEAWAHRCAWRYLPGSLPTTAAIDPNASADALKILHLRKAKRGEGGCLWYPSLEAIFERAGHRGVFDGPGRREKAEAWARGCAARYGPGRLPSSSARDPVGKNDAAKIANIKLAKLGKAGVYYPSVGRIFEEAGHPGVFDPVDRLAEVESWARECAARYRPGRLPPANAKDPVAKRDGMKIHRHRMAKHGKGTCTYYPSIEGIFEEAGHTGVFDRIARPRLSRPSHAD